MTAQADGDRTTRGLLWAEFLGLFVLAPLALAVLVPPGVTYPVLFVLAGTVVIGAWLLQRTPSFAWRDLLVGVDRIGWGTVAWYTLATVAVCLSVILLTRPEELLNLPRSRPETWVLVLVFYPILSALPQELIFRPLFFRRYGPILPSGPAALVLNALVFSLAHLMYWNWVVMAMTLCGGLIFAWAYEARRNFPMAVLMHAVAGWVLFTLGLGVYFYSGNVVRPF